MSADPSAVKSRVGYVPEIHSIYRWMRVDEVIDVYERIHRVPELKMIL